MVNAAVEGDQQAPLLGGSDFLNRLSQRLYAWSMLYPALDLLHLCYDDEKLPRLRLTSLFKLVQILIWVWTLESSDHRACTNSRQARILHSCAFILRVRTQALIRASCMHVVWRREKLSALTQKGFLEHFRLDSTFALGTPRRFIIAPSHPHQYVSPSPVSPLPLALHGVSAFCSSESASRRCCPH